MGGALLGWEGGLLFKMRSSTLEKAGKLCGRYNVPMDIIPMVDYGMCNGEKVLRFAQKLANR